MRNGKIFPEFLTLILLIAPTVFSACATTKSVSEEDVKTALAAVQPPAPAAPEIEPVQFEDRDGGLWLSYDNYRALERNVIALREYAARLEIIIGFYREE
jgi:hypothetical protein